jgi:hypothetical protein
MANPVPDRAKDPKRKVTPDPETSFHEVQVRKNKGKWTTRYSAQGKGIEMARMYGGINVGNGYSKRFRVDGTVTHTTHGLD